MNGSWTFSRKKKNTPLYFFFSASRKKKNTQFYDLIDWMAHELYQEKKKIRYLWPAIFLLYLGFFYYTCFYLYLFL